MINMPSLILANPVASGAQTVISGNPWSGRPSPIGGIQFRWVSSGGNCYIGMSGGGPPLSGNFMTRTSGGMFLSGSLGGYMDGMLMAPGDSYFMPKSAIALSGNFNMFAIVDPAASGVGRLFFEIY